MPSPDKQLHPCRKRSQGARQDGNDKHGSIRLYPRLPSIYSLSFFQAIGQMGKKQKG
ncbi:hypothetical protein EMPG_09981 [Blastomyces silverae]|uniref:Uncharacterized protein n=1 Tax=Blastomyces silverae TaxID=2060906 RepID=A0A0H1B964_9EURO|nr:hypothetical protein EMPG_09981 [Blastomyces silverae]